MIYTYFLNFFQMCFDYWVSNKFNLIFYCFRTGIFIVIFSFTATILIYYIIFLLYLLKFNNWLFCFWDIKFLFFFFNFFYYVYVSFLNLIHRQFAFLLFKFLTKYWHVFFGGDFFVVYDSCLFLFFVLSIFEIIEVDGIWSNF
jgi:hypothetical protein